MDRIRGGAAGALAGLFALLLVACGGGGSDAGTTPPPPSGASVTLDSPANLASVTGLLTLAATPSASVAAMQFQIDGEPLGSEVTMAPYTASLNTGDYAAGQHVVRARSRDASGALSAWASATVKFGGTQSVGAGFTKTDAWIGGLSNATAFTQAADGRFFVSQQGGALRVVKNGALLAAPFHTFIDIDSTGERGLLGVALHPNFASNHWVYIYRTTTTGGTHNRISRLVANGDVSDGSETVLVNLPLLGPTNHNGGGIHFGPDGKLYVGVGENGQSANAQDLSSVLGKMLRYNDDGSIPSDNPFCGTASDPKCAVWAYGLRNPFTFAFQPGTGKLYINDVGENTWEEIDTGAAGANYGWPNSEGPDNVGSGITGPLFAYKHSDASPAGSGPGGFLTGHAITGGTFYPASGGSFPAAYGGQYFFADLVSAFVARYDPVNNTAYSFASLAGNPVDMLVGVSDSALYVLMQDGITRITRP